MSGSSVGAILDTCIQSKRTRLLKKNPGHEFNADNIEILDEASNDTCSKACLF